MAKVIEERIIQQVACFHCGQSIFIGDAEITDEEQANNFAISRCDCEAAKKQQERLRTRSTIEALFGDGAALIQKEAVDFDAKAIMNHIAEGVCNEVIKSASLKIELEEGICIFKVAVNSKGDVIVDRADTQKVQRII